MIKVPNANYKFTDKKVSPFSVMSIVLSFVSFVALLASVIISFKTAGQVELKTGITTLLCLVFSLTALVLSIRTYFQKNVFHVFSHIWLIKTKHSRTAEIKYIIPDTVWADFNPP